MDLVIDQTSEREARLDKIEVDTDLSRVIEGTIFKIMLEDIEDHTVDGNIEVIVIGVMITIEVEIDQGRGHSQEVIVVIELEV